MAERAVVTKTGSLQSAPALSYAAIKYPKGSVFVLLTEGEVGNFDSLTAAMPNGSASQLLADDQSEAGKTLSRKLSKALDKPVYLATSASAAAARPAVEAELISLVRDL